MKKYDESIYYTLGSEVAILMQLKDKLIVLNNAIDDLLYSNYMNNDITFHICLHHNYGKSYVPIIEIKKDFVMMQIVEEKTLVLSQLDKQLTKVKVLNAIVELNPPVIKEVEELLSKEEIPF